MRLSCLVLLCALGAATAAAAQNRPYQLVCFEAEGISRSLDKVVNAQQFLRNDRILKSGSCDFAQIPRGSTARYVGIHQSRNGFLFPLFRVTYATTGQRMFAADGIFREGQWRILRRRGTGINLLTPATCDVLDGYFQAGGGTPSYLVIPPICAPQVIE
jgi:hypothetical protein